MRYVNSRKYPITYRKENRGNAEKILDMSITSAVGILVFAFAKGMFWGYMLKKWRG